MLLLIFSLLLLGAFFFMHFKSLLNGVYTIFAISLGLALNWNVIMDLDDPFTGLWNVEIPNDWARFKRKDHDANIKVDFWKMNDEMD
jgi:hypothetical protein